MHHDHHDGRTDSVDRMIDEALSRRFEPPAATGFIPPAVFDAGSGAASSSGHLAGASRTVRSAWARVAAVAACLAMLAFSGWSLWSYFRPMPPGEACQTPITRLDAYLTIRQAGFVPEQALNDPAAALQAVGDHVGVPLAIGDLPPGVEVRGMTMCPGVSPWCAALLTRVDGADVVVFIDRRAVLVGGQQAKHELEKDAAREGVFEHGAVLDSVSLNEVSPYPRPRLIGLIREGR